jgi:hypothetical protein
MDPSSIDNYCRNSNAFSEVFAPTVQGYLPAQDSIRSAVVEHTTGTNKFLSTVSQELCNDGIVGEAGKDSTLSWIARSSTSAGVLSAAAVAAVLGAPVAGVVAGGALGLAFGPPIAERAILSAKDFATNILDRTKAYLRGDE